MFNLFIHSWQDFLNMFFRDVYKPISSDYNLVLAMLWRHPENINLDKVKVVHYCAAVSILQAHIKTILHAQTIILSFWTFKFYNSNNVVHWFTGV